MVVGGWVGIKSYGCNIDIFTLTKNKFYIASALIKIFIFFLSSQNMFSNILRCLGLCTKLND